MTQAFDPKRSARLERAYGKLLEREDAPQPVGQRCHAVAPSTGLQCARWLGTAKTDDGGYRCANHRPGGKQPRLWHAREIVQALERLEPTLRGLLTWLDPHRTAGKAA